MQTRTKQVGKKEKLFIVSTNKKKQAKQMQKNTGSKATKKNKTQFSKNETQVHNNTSDAVHLFDRIYTEHDTKNNDAPTVNPVF